MTHATDRLNAYSRKEIKDRSAIKCRETAIHKAILQYCKFQMRRDVVVFHVANERRTTPKDGAFLKSLGVVAGVPDLIFVCAGGITCWLEIKVPGGRLSPDQKAFHDHLASLEHRCAVVHSLEEAVHVMRLWNLLKPTAMAA